MLQLPGRWNDWNALKKQADYYSNEEKQKLIAVDPFVPYNMIYHESRGKACRTGESVVSGISFQASVSLYHMILHL